MTADKQSQQLTVHLAEHSRLVGENHATFQRQQQQLNIIVLLASGIVGTLAIKIDYIHSNPEIFTWIPIPFLLITCLHLRDDLKLHAIDEYIWRVLRRRTMDLTGLTDSQVWNWLQVANVLKFSASKVFGYAYFMLSMLRYAIPATIICTSLCLYLLYSPVNVFCILNVWTMLFYLDVTATLIVFVGGLYMVRRSGRFIYGDENAFITKGLLIPTMKINGEP
jgi:hypothetical protein